MDSFFLCVFILCINLKTIYSKINIWHFKCLLNVNWLIQKRTKKQWWWLTMKKQCFVFWPINQLCFTIEITLRYFVMIDSSFSDICFPVDFGKLYNPKKKHSTKIPHRPYVCVLNKQKTDDSLMINRFLLHSLSRFTLIIVNKDFRQNKNWFNHHH